MSENAVFSAMTSITDSQSTFAGSRRTASSSTSLGRIFTAGLRVNGNRLVTRASGSESYPRNSSISINGRGFNADDTINHRTWFITDLNLYPSAGFVVSPVIQPSGTVAIGIVGEFLRQISGETETANAPTEFYFEARARMSLTSQFVVGVPDASITPPDSPTGAGSFSDWVGYTRSVATTSGIPANPEFNMAFNVPVIERGTLYSLRYLEVQIRNVSATLQGGSGVHIPITFNRINAVSNYSLRVTRGATNHVRTSTNRNFFLMSFDNPPSNNSYRLDIGYTIESSGAMATTTALDIRPNTSIRRYSTIDLVTPPVKIRIFEGESRTYIWIVRDDPNPFASSGFTFTITSPVDLASFECYETLVQLKEYFEKYDSFFRDVYLEKEYIFTGAIDRVVFSRAVDTNLIFTNTPQDDLNRIRTLYDREDSFYISMTSGRLPNGEDVQQDPFDSTKIFKVICSNSFDPRISDMYFGVGTSINLTLRSSR